MSPVLIIFYKYIKRDISIEIFRVTYKAKDIRVGIKRWVLPPTPSVSRILSVPKRSVEMNLDRSVFVTSIGEKNFIQLHMKVGIPQFIRFKWVF